MVSRAIWGSYPIQYTSLGLAFFLSIVPWWNGRSFFPKFNFQTQSPGESANFLKFLHPILSKRVTNYLVAPSLKTSCLPCKGLRVMGCAFTVAVYDFTPIYSPLWQSVSMAVGYPGCGTAIPHLLNSPYFTKVSFPSSGHIEISKPFRSFPSILFVFIIPSSRDKMLHFWSMFWLEKRVLKKVS